MSVMSQCVHAGRVVPVGARVIIDQMSACRLLSCPLDVDVTGQL